ncbi:MAG: RNA-binding protein [Gammaproteobacteria bacterium RBG_16_51_14]|nr:MAG: RNA-binding protein [Gammaproteobacteria bacterium RBG_16_51_14]
MNLSKEQEKFLRKLAHSLDPVAWVGQNGLTDRVMEEIEAALDHHELVKVKIRVGDRELRGQTITLLCEKSRAVLVQKIGNTVTLYRKNRKNPGIALP